MMPFQGALALTCVLTALNEVQASILGIDMGGEFMKASIIQPSKSAMSPISILLNKESKRKTPSAVSFFEEWVSFGNDAMSHATKAPKDVVQHGFRNLGLSKAQQVAFDSKFYPMQYEENKRGTLDVVVKGQKMALETAIAHVIGNIRDMAKEGENAVKEMPTQTVFTVPSSFTQRQRQAVVNAATISGLKVIAIVGETIATAIQRAVDYSPKEPTNVLIFNMGSTHAEACIVEFSSQAEKKGTAPVVRNLGCAEDTQIGGHFVDLKLADHVMEVFVTKYPKFAEAKSSIRVWRKLLTQAIKTKTTLSANKEAAFIVEGLYEDTDFSTMVKREKLEELSKDMLNRIPQLVKKALLEAKVAMDQIKAAEVVGGAWRQPKVLSLLTEMLGKDAAGNPKELGQHLNGEEAAALGAVIHAGSYSNQFNVKKISYNDIRKYGYALEVTEFDTNKMMLRRDDDASTSLISQGSARGGPREKKKLVLTECPCYNDIKVDLYEKQSDKSAPVHLTTYEVRGVAAIIEKRITNSKHKLNVPKDMPKIVLSVAGDTNNTGIVTLSKAEMVIEGSYMAEVDGTQKEKTMKYTDNLKLVVVEHNPRPMNHEEMHNAIEALQATQQHDKDVRKLAGTINDLESYIYNTNEKLESESWIGVSTEEMRKELSDLLKSTDAWLQEGGSDRKLKDFEEKLHALQGKSDPIQERAMEAEYRADLIDWVKDQLSKAQTKQKDLKKNMAKSDLSKTKQMDDTIEDFVSWWKKVQEKQKANPPHVTPFFTKKEVRTRMAAVSGEIEKLRKPKKGKEKVDTTDWDLEKVEAEFKRIDAAKVAAIKDGDYEKAANLKKERKHFESIAQALKEKPEL